MREKILTLLLLLASPSLVAAKPSSPDNLPSHPPPFQQTTAPVNGLAISSIAAGGYRVVPFGSGLPRAGLAPECDARGADVIQSVGTYIMIDGVCEDGSETPCGGRFTLAVENCGSIEGTQIQISDAPMLTQYRGSAFFALNGTRICFDPTADSDCILPDSDSVVIARVDSVSSRALLTEITGIPTGEIHGSSRLVDTMKFPMDGRMVQLDPAPFSSRTVYERIDPTNLTCGLPQFGLPDCEQNYTTRRIR